jgi:hypothetical protein
MAGLGKMLESRGGASALQVLEKYPDALDGELQLEPAAVTDVGRAMLAVIVQADSLPPNQPVAVPAGVLSVVLELAMRHVLATSGSVVANDPAQAL